MSKRKTIVWVLSLIVLLLAVIFAGFYLYKKNSGPKPLTKEQIEEMQRQELMNYPVDLSKQKSEAEQKKDLQQFTTPANSQLSEEEMRKVLTSPEVQP